MDTPTRTRSTAERRPGKGSIPEGPLAGTGNRGPRRRLQPAGQAIVVGIGALVLGAFLNAPGLHKTADSLNPGWKRSVVLPLTEKLAVVSHDVGLDFPRRGLKAVIGRSGDDTIQAAIKVPPPPPPPPKHPHKRPVVPPTKHHGTPPPPPPPKKPAFSPKRPLRVYIGGDSLIITPGESLLRAMGSKVYKPIDSVDGRISTGLERPDVYNWFDRIRQVMKKDRPKVVVVAFGANDDHSYMTGLRPGQSLGDFGSPAWRKEYARRVGGFMDTVIRNHGFIVYIGMPIVSSSSESSDFDLLNGIIYKEAKRRPHGALYVDTYLRFADPKTGGYAEYLPKPDGTLVKVRSGDGVHFEPAGGDIIARLVLKALNQRFDLTGWRNQHR